MNSFAILARAALGLLAWVSVASTPLLIQPGPASAVTLSRQPAALQDMKQRPAEVSCKPGFYLSVECKCCLRCEAGIEYTSYTNSLPTCMHCSECREDQVVKTACTTTSNTVCQCKNDTFRTTEAPEFCQRCRDRCPEGEVEVVSCDSWHDRKCVPKAAGGTGAPEKPVNTTTEPPTSTSSHLEWVIGGILGLVMIGFCVRYVVCTNRNLSSICPGPGGLAALKTAFSKCCTRPAEVQDNNHNETLSLGPLPSTVHVEQETGRPNRATRADARSPGEAQCLLEGPAKKRLLVPVDGVDPIETLKLSFIYFQSVIPLKSWDKLMRQMGLSDNDILLARAVAPHDALYEMLLRWLQKTGRHASLNTLLDALETLGERCARDKIEDHVVHSGKFVYEDDVAGPRAGGSHPCSQLRAEDHGSKPAQAGKPLPCTGASSVSASLESEHPLPGEIEFRTSSLPALAPRGAVQEGDTAPGGNSTPLYPPYPLIPRAWCSAHAHHLPRPAGAAAGKAEGESSRVLRPPFSSTRGSASSSDAFTSRRLRGRARGTFPTLTSTDGETRRGDGPDGRCSRGRGPAPLHQAEIQTAQPPPAGALPLSPRRLRQGASAPGSFPHPASRQAAPRPGSGGCAGSAVGIRLPAGWRGRLGP
ncbi:tumor necrosis factor receptor superfamily member 10B-like [Perognathus longimembris pacificus]|uniref:tumor necrosis factor receptor superfamily member 10B-like n=1 Tax=Perognathus longimembris pacificus TaxID=214514 RepID=UPI0020192D85|nr:tumor necrosis factor receptor superfamily member 10B-like [Perognathus longimembris pacificus]